MRILSITLLEYTNLHIRITRAPFILSEEESISVSDIQEHQILNFIYPTNYTKNYCKVIYTELTLS